MRDFLSAFFVLGLATSAHADDSWSGYLDIGTSYERINGYNEDWNLGSIYAGYRNSASAELQYKWNACAVGARATIEAVEGTSTPVGSPSYVKDVNFGDEAYGIAGQVGCNLNGLWLVGFGGVKGTEFRHSEANFFLDYLEKDFGAGIYYRSSERFGLGIAVSRLNTSYTYASYNSTTGEAEFDTDTVTGKIDYFISPNLLYSTTASYSEAPRRERSLRALSSNQKDSISPLMQASVDLSTITNFLTTRQPLTSRPRSACAGTSPTARCRPTTTI